MRVQLSEVNLDVEVSGEGPAVLLLHGFPDSHVLWRHQVPVLNAAGFRTVAPTLRGFGGSDRPEGGPAAYHPGKHIGDLLELLASLDVDRFHLVGHDWGSGIAQGLASVVPDRVRSLSLLSVGHLASILSAGWEQRQRSWYMLLFQLPGVAEEWLARDDHAGLREMLAGHPDAEAAIEPLRAPGALTAALNIYRSGLPAEVQFGAAPPVVPLPDSIPVMGVWSTGDPFLTERSMSGTHAHVLGRWRYERLEDTGHWLPLERPEAVGDLLLSFLKEA
ncbi:MULTISPECIES: alpha/beta fold hydrolase [Streptomyces]|uniref:Alpha/beta hydrolase n=1 Tax=Streptomyces hydrogenans TaxID=1873719 RepID=A0ABQ3P520_9ACTN|nr:MULTISPECIES: alpha/beta fold hydrolase [Streptomyces]MCM1946289.1 alpha/beta fold hydrolase [Streptomyces sp. G2]GHE24407.1 alpha/beta hydrolase [Streptomyces hydrogenans]GHI20117.1 alpha/beta hydrolase [Streptomyces hydrogenans]